MALGACQNHPLEHTLTNTITEEDRDVKDAAQHGDANGAGVSGVGGTMSCW